MQKSNGIGKRKESELEVSVNTAQELKREFAVTQAAVSSLLPIDLF
jgi:hypothetical protein